MFVRIVVVQLSHTELVHIVVIIKIELLKKSKKYFLGFLFLNKYLWQLVT